MKILGIGNSFSQDAQRWLHDIAEVDNFELDTVNLFIGGCGLETHWDNVIKKTEAYDMEGNGGEFLKKISINDALENDKYDIVTLQQVSDASGIEQSYFPFIINLADFVREKQPQAKIYLHRTWSYEIDSNWGGYVNYGSSQKEMYRCICEATQNVSEVIKAEILPVGDVIQKLRENTKEFDYKNGGVSLCRDGGHLSLDYGRFAAAATWYKKITSRSVNTEKFVEKNPNFDINILNVILKEIGSII